MGKLNPPILDNTIPAFYDRDKLIIPFNMNKAVGIAEVSGLRLKMKNVYNNNYLFKNSILD